MRVAAIHQPTFLPWLGWWDKLVRADVLVLLDDVQFPKKGGTWMNRVRLLVNGEPVWATVPVDRAFHGVRTVRETRIDDSVPWREKMAKTIATSYGRAPYFDEVYDEVRALIRLPTDRLAEFNENAIRRIGDSLGLETARLVRQSDLGIGGSGNELLVSLCRAVSADTYLTGDGAGEYLSTHSFAAAGIGVVEQRFTPPRYPQLARAYVPGLSVVDALMNCGWRRTARLVSPSG